MMLGSGKILFSCAPFVLESERKVLLDCVVGFNISYERLILMLCRVRTLNECLSWNVFMSCLYLLKYKHDSLRYKK